MAFVNDNIQILDWASIRRSVQVVNADLAKYIDDFDPSKEFHFIKVSYRFGQSILKNGRLQLPVSKEDTAFLNDNRIPVKLKRSLGYCALPMSLLLNKKAEVFYESENRVMPTKVLGKGSMMGLWEAFDPAPKVFAENVWNITAGARSLFVLPKVSNQLAHKQLQRAYGLNAYPPSHMLHHHQIFKEIAAKDDKNEWVLDVIFFGEKWAALQDMPSLESLKLNHYLLKEAWKQSYNCRNNMAFNMSWELFSKAVSERNMKPKPLIVNTLKHLLAINDGFYPGYGPAINEEAAPVQLIRDAYCNIYQSKADPTLMEPFHLASVQRPAYYSFQLPSLLENAPGVHGKNIIIDLRELKVLMEMLQVSFEENCLQFSYFHPNEDVAYGIEHSRKIFDIDPNFQIQAEAHSPCDFAKSSPFLKGCVQIALSSDRALPLPLGSVDISTP